jgi:hypothetical protein
MNLCIELIDLTLRFKIQDNPLAKLWLDRMALRDQYPLDDPYRFYGFGSQQQEENNALVKIQTTCTDINKWNPIIERSIESVTDQDTLNYLHSIFEQYHGLLDTKPMHPVYGEFPQKIRKHLAELNVDVHRCESVARGNRPRFVCTWYGLPKTQVLSDNLLQHSTLNPKFGSVCLNYCEIGKTLEDLAQDNDNYISDAAFRPFRHYSADFNVRLHEETVSYCAEKLSRMQQYYCQHLEFFTKQGYESFQDSRLLPLRFPVADLIETMSRDQLLEEIKQRQLVTKVYLE